MIFLFKKPMEELPTLKQIMAVIKNTDLPMLMNIQGLLHREVRRRTEAIGSSTDVKRATVHFDE